MRRMLEGVMIAGLAVGLAFPVLAEDTATTDKDAAGSAATVEKQGKKCNSDQKVAADIKHDQKVARRKAEKAFNKQQAAERKKFFERQKDENQAFRKKQEAEKKKFLEMQAARRKAFHGDKAAASAGKQATGDVEVDTDKATDKDTAPAKTE